MFSPHLIEEIFAELERNGLFSGNILKIETNLSPLGDEHAKSRFNYEQLSILSGIVPVHATLHFPPGGSREWKLIEAGINKAIAIGLELYPAIGGADWSSFDLNNLFESLYSINQNLPLRLAVRPFQLDYPALNGRRKASLLSEKRDSVLYWDSLLQEKYGRGYLEQPRHTIKLD